MCGGVPPSLGEVWVGAGPVYRGGANIRPDCPGDKAELMTALSLLSLT
jgi:hypothetical protein